MVYNNNNKSISTAQNHVPRDYSKRAHEHTYTQAPAHTNIYIIHNTQQEEYPPESEKCKAENMACLMVCKNGNVYRLDFNKSSEGFFERERAMSVHVEGPKKEGRGNQQLKVCS